MAWCMGNWEDSYCIFRLHHNVSNIGSAYVDSLYVVIPEKHTICYMDYEKEIAKPKPGFGMLSAYCVSTDSDVWGCMENSVTKDGFCIYLKNVLKIASIQLWWVHTWSTLRSLLLFQEHTSV